MPSIPSSHSRVDGTKRVATSDRRTMRHRTTLDKIRQVEELQLFTFNPAVHQGSIKATTSGLELTNFAFLEEIGDAATAGVIRLANNTFIEWRNQANNANIGFGVNTANNFFIDTLLDMNGQAIDNVFDITDNNSNPAIAGFLRLGNAISINWRNAANDADLGLTLNSSNQFILGGPLISSQDDADDLGSSANIWQDVFARQFLAHDSDTIVRGSVFGSNDPSDELIVEGTDDVAISTDGGADTGTITLNGFVHHPMRLIRKTADETVNNSSTLQNDNHLSFIMDANELWILELTIFYDSNTTADIKVGITLPSGATYRGGQSTLDATGSGSVEQIDRFSDNDAGLAALNAGGAGAGVVVMATFRFFITISSTPGVCQVVWAQRVANVSNTIMLAGSYLKAFRI